MRCSNASPQCWHRVLGLHLQCNSEALPLLRADCSERARRMTNPITELREALMIAAQDLDAYNLTYAAYRARAVLDRTKPEEAPMTRDALKAQIAELQARLDAMPEPVVYRAYWRAMFPHVLFAAEQPDSPAYLEWTVENGVPKVLGDFRRIEE
jgi:hypothetical protein